MSFSRVPDEIIQHLLYHVSPTDNLDSLQLVSRRLRSLATEPLLWRYHCRNSFRYWSPVHCFDQRLRLRALDVEWQQLYIKRMLYNKRVATLLREIIASKVGRLKRFEQIARLGYDAKDYLISQCRVDESAHDYLARRYYSNALLDAIHRSIAIDEWHHLWLQRDSLQAQVAGVRLERALGAFDMFVLHDDFGDLADISHMLDDRIAQFRATLPNLCDLSTRQKALALNRWLRANGLTGICNQEGAHYRNLRNLFIGQALRHDSHDSLPVISSAIFCCLAARLGLTAQCCAFPGHVHAIVSAAPGLTLDGAPADEHSEPPERMYLDPFGFDHEVPAAGFHALLAHLGWHTSADALAPVSTLAIVLRTAHNIKATFLEFLALQDSAPRQLNQLLSGNNSMNMEAALYSSMWAPLMLTPPNTFEWDDHLASFLRRFAGSWPEDVWLVEKYLKPMYSHVAPVGDGFAHHHANRGLGDPWEHWRLVQSQDDMKPPVFRRSSSANQPVPFKIGQVFRHRRYGWIGVITGWSEKGTRHLPVPHATDLDESMDSNATEPPSILLQPPNQFYFMCFPSTGSEPHVVAAHNIELIQNANQINDDMFPLAGKFFKRFDRSTCTFVSNIKEQYPDD
ncbi:hypothetical protein CDD82_1168 [Ophiocordyceps australis]|uniref:F-box domain-containing protein n=1 Tax=Ophiocordyceps australis TaxID=1399860 RepID=A0A2C5YT30_9HYPO|nr:hypothetical protein CDD82_1168 [Ophiocordyceps australis]